MTQKGPGFSIIPTKCPKFVACCATLGIPLEEGSPKITNVYDSGRKYDPDEPGEIGYLLSDKSQVANPLAVAKVWADPSQDMIECAAIQSRIATTRDITAWNKLADDIAALHVWGAVAHIKLFTQNKFAIDTRVVSDNEERAAQWISDLPETVRKSKPSNGPAIAAKFADNWTPAMFAWVKAWIFNYLELRDVWKAARPAIKIDRGDDFPLIIPKGKNFAKMMKRWA